MRHVPIAEFKDKVSEVVAAAEAGEEIIVTRHGREVVKVIGIASDRMAKQRRAIAAMLDTRERLRGEGVRISTDELIAWKNEGRQ